MYKFLSGILLIAFLIAVGIDVWNNFSLTKQNTKLSNDLAKAEKIVKETNSAFSIRGQQLEDLKSNNEELQKKIDKREEDIAALGQANLKLKDQLFKIKNAKLTVIDPTGNPTNEPLSCDIPNLRVDFEKEQDLWRVSGFCLTSPPSAEVSVSWSRPLQLSFILTKKNNQYRLYLDSNSPDTIAVQNLSLKVDPSVFEQKWYEKIAVGFDVGFTGKEPIASVRGTFDVGSFSPGAFMILFNGKEGLERAYGVSLMWRPF